MSCFTDHLTPQRVALLEVSFASWVGGDACARARRVSFVDLPLALMGVRGNERGEMNPADHNVVC